MAEGELFLGVILHEVEEKPMIEVMSTRLKKYFDSFFIWSRFIRELSLPRLNEYYHSCIVEGGKDPVVLCGHFCQVCKTT